MRRLLFIINAHAHERTQGDILAIRRYLAEHAFKDAETEVFLSETVEAAQNLVRRRIEERAVDVVVAVGGDGSIMALLPLLIHHPQIKLGIVPLGTGNLLAYNLGIPDIQTAFEAIEGNVSKAIDIGRIGRHYFGLMCMIGTEAKAFNLPLPPWIKRNFGVIAYMVKHVRGLVMPDQACFRLESPDKTIETMGHSLIISNAARCSKVSTPYIAGSSWEDGLLDFCLIRAETPGGRLKAAWRIMTGGGRRRHDDVLVQFQAPWLKIRCFPPPVISVDGTQIDATSDIEVEVVPNGIQVLVPAGQVLADEASSEAGQCRVAPS